jgi:hypothetical protein
VFLRKGYFCLRQLGANPEVLAKAIDRLLVAAVLFKTAALVEHVRWILGTDEKLSQDGDTFGPVSRKARRPGLSLLGVDTCSCRSRRHQEQGQDGQQDACPNHDEASQLTNLSLAQALVNHSGKMLP